MKMRKKIQCHSKKIIFDSTNNSMDDNTNKQWITITMTMLMGKNTVPFFSYRGIKMENFFNFQELH